MSQKVQQIITDKIIAALESGDVAPWRKPWAAAAMSLQTGKAYRGINVLLLAIATMEHGFTSRYWVTKKQCLQRGARIKADQFKHSTIVVYWNWIKKEDKATGETSSFPMLRYYQVWNADQCDGLNLPQGKENETIADGQTVMDSYLSREKIELSHGGDRAFYRPSTDSITLPTLNSFQTSDHYYATAYHEMVHSTGHDSRLKRGLDTNFGSHEYSREELVAEIGAAMLSMETGIHADMENTTAYIQSWLKALKNDRTLITTAAQRAQKAVDLILDRQPDYEEKDTEE